MRRGLLDGWCGILTEQSPSVAMEERRRFKCQLLGTEVVVSFLLCRTSSGTVDQHTECGRDALVCPGRFRVFSMLAVVKQAIVIPKATQSAFPSVHVSNPSTAHISRIRHRP